MDIAMYEVPGRVRVTVLQPKGDVDGRTFKELIGKAQQAHSAGARDMVIDLGAVGYLSSSGLVAINSIWRLLQGREMPDLEAGWSTLRAVERDLEEREPPRSHLKLANPQPAVDSVLEVTGFKRVMEVYAEVGVAVAAF